MLAYMRVSGRGQLVAGLGEPSLVVTASDGIDDVDGDGVEAGATETTEQQLQQVEDQSRRPNRQQYVA